MSIISLHKTCSSCKDYTDKYYFRKETGTFRNQCIRCMVENELDRREKKYSLNRDLEREKSRIQKKKWRASRCKKKDV